jgi:hypothetical protein
MDQSCVKENRSKVRSARLNIKISKEKLLIRMDVDEE